MGNSISGSPEIIKYLVEQGANVNEKDGHGNTALHFAANDGSWEIVKYLVEHGANVNEKDGDGNTGLYKAAFSGSLEIVKYLVEYEVNVNEKNVVGDSALLVTARHGWLKIVKYLVEHRADINCKSMKDKTALHYAVEFGSLEMVEYLVENGANVTREELHGEKTVLYLAFARRNEFIFDYLLQHGAMIDMHDYDHSSRSFLNIACYEGQTALVQILLKFNVNMRQELELICGNDEIINMLNLELKKSIKHRERIKKLKALDKKMLTKVMYFEVFR